MLWVASVTALTLSIIAALLHSSYRPLGCTIVTVHQAYKRKQDRGIRDLSPNGSLRRGARYAALRAGLRHVETEIGKWRAETDARKPPARDRKLKFAGQRLGHARMRSRIPVPVDTFRCSLFALEFPPNDPTR